MEIISNKFEENILLFLYLIIAAIVPAFSASVDHFSPDIFIIISLLMSPMLGHRPSL
jgi:uncharacterized membrane protein